MGLKVRLLFYSDDKEATADTELPDGLSPFPGLILHQDNDEDFIVEEVELCLDHNPQTIILNLKPRLGESDKVDFQTLEKSGWKLNHSPEPRPVVKQGPVSNPASSDSEQPTAEEQEEETGYYRYLSPNISDGQWRYLLASNLSKKTKRVIRLFQSVGNIPSVKNRKMRFNLTNEEFRKKNIKYQLAFAGWTSEPRREILCQLRPVIPKTPALKYWNKKK